jgi:hypothetical protein
MLMAMVLALFLSGSKDMVDAEWRGGLGSVDNRAGRSFTALASGGKSGQLRLVIIAPLSRGGGKSHPWRGADGEVLNDLDFIFATDEAPINGKTRGAFRVGWNRVILKPDPSDSANTLIENWHSYLPAAQPSPE